MEHGSTTLHVDEDGTFDGYHHGGRRVRVSRDEGDLEAWADLRIAVPAGRSLELHLAVGRIAAANVDGRLRLEAVAAPVTVAGGRGNLLVSTVSGDVRVSGGNGPARLSTGSGDVRLSQVRAPDVGVETGSGDVTLELQSVVQVLDVETGSGDVSIVAPPSTSARLEIEAGSGDIESDFPLAVTRSGRHHLTGTIGDGKGRVSVGTGSGGVRLMRSKGA